MIKSILEKKKKSILGKSDRFQKTRRHPRANKFQSKTYQANSPTKQEHNPKHKNIGGQKSHQTHRHLKIHYWTLYCTQREEIQLHPLEHQRKLT